MNVPATPQVKPQAKPHIMMIGLSREVHAKARGLGARLSALVPLPKLEGRKSLDIYERLVGLPADSPVDAWIDMARHIHRLQPVDAIGGFNEETQEHAAQVATALGLPFHKLEVIRATRNKAEMRDVLRKRGLDDTPSRLVAGTDEVADLGERHGYPLVLKPVDGRGSLGVAIVRAEREIAAALERYAAHATRHRMLAEGFLAGEEYSVEAFSEEGRHRVICVTQKFKDPVTCVETGHCLPAPIPEGLRARLADFVASALSAIGLKDGPSHTEVIVTAGGPRIVETHARLAGDSIVDLIRLASGVDLDELWVRQVMGERVLERVPAQLSRFAAVSFVTPSARGTLERVDGEAEARGLPGVEVVRCLQDAGARLEGAYDSYARGAFAVATGSTAEEAVERARAAAGRLRFVVSCPG